MRVFYYINNQEVNRPLNYKELAIELNFDKDDINSQAISVTEFEWGLGDSTDGNDAAILINAHRTGGLNGTSPGVFEGLPFRIELDIDGSSYQLFDGYLNTAEAEYDCDRVITTAVEKGNVDWLRDTSDSIDFENLYDPSNEKGLPSGARITNADFIDVPYVLSELPDTREALLATISMTFLLETISTQLEEVIEISISLPNVLEWTAALRLILRVLYLVGLFLILLVTIKRIINLLIQKTKYHAVMRVKTLCEKGAAYFGKTFKSTILENQYKDLVILPKKFTHQTNVETYGGAGSLTGAQDTLIGFFTPSQNDMRGFYNGTFGGLLRALKEMFNAKIIMQGNILRLEREDYNNSAQNYVLPDRDVDNYTLNYQDLMSNYSVEFLEDLNDKNTLQNYEGTITKATTKPKSVVNRDMVLMTGFEVREIPFARATRKTALTSVEKIVDFIAPLIDGVATVLVAIVNTALTIADTIVNSQLASALLLSNTMGLTNYAILGVIVGDLTPNIADIVNWFNLNIYNTGLDLTDIPRLDYTPIGDSIENRIGMLQMENDWVSIPKIFLIDESTTSSNTKIKSSNDTLISSLNLWNNFHFLRSFVSTNSNPKGNQWKEYSVDNVPFTCADYLLLRNNNRLKDAQGRTGEVVSCRWEIESDITKAKIDYRINEKYSNNLELEINTPDGK